MATKVGKVGKQKNHKASTKRFKKTGSGKWRMEKSCRRHLLLQKSDRQKKQGSKAQLLSKGDSKNISRLVPSA